jgi:hypothetical protein
MLQIGLLERSASGCGNLRRRFLCQKLLDPGRKVLLQLGMEFPGCWRSEAGVDCVDRAVTTNEDRGRPGVEVVELRNLSHISVGAPASR